MLHPYLTEEFVRSRYNYKTAATQPGSKSGNNISVTHSRNITLGSDNNTDHEEEGSLPKKNVSFDDNQCYAMLAAIDLSTSGLRRSKRIQEHNKSQSQEPASRMAYAIKLKEKS